MSRRRSRPLSPAGAPWDAAGSDSQAIAGGADNAADDAGGDGDGDEDEIAEPTAEQVEPDAPSVKLDIETLHAVPAAPARVGLLDLLNAEARRAEHRAAFTDAGALHALGQRLVESLVAVPSARDAAASDDLIDRLETLIDLL